MVKQIEYATKKDLKTLEKDLRKLLKETIAKLKPKKAKKAIAHKK